MLPRASRKISLQLSSAGWKPSTAALAVVASSGDCEGHSDNLPEHAEVLKTGEDCSAELLRKPHTVAGRDNASLNCCEFVIHGEFDRMFPCRPDRSLRDDGPFKFENESQDAKAALCCCELSYGGFCSRCETCETTPQRVEY
jgi:hypothetical protein